MARWLPVLVSACFVAAGCSLFKASDASSAKGVKTVWHSGQQNVKIERQDLKGSSPNDQPIVLASDQVRNAFAALEVRMKPSAKPVPVFTNPEIDLLETHITEALAQAGPNEDVTFSIIGQRKAIYGLAKERKVTSGRVFYRDGKLNVIFGRMVEDIGQYDGVSAKPITSATSPGPGMRSKPVPHDWVLEMGPYMQFHPDAGRYRTDWIEVDLAAVAAAEALGLQEKAREEAKEAARQAVAQEQAGSAPVGKTSKTVEERLLALDNLKSKKLITEEEYKAKRADILKDL
jgi:hypothetical protein